MRCGPTPTDMMHIKGYFNRYDTEAAKLGDELVTLCVGVSPDTLSDMVYDTVKKTLYINTVRLLLEDKYPSFKKNGLGAGLETLISERAGIWQKVKKNKNF